MERINETEQYTYEEFNEFIEYLKSNYNSYDGRIKKHVALIIRLKEVAIYYLTLKYGKLSTIITDAGPEILYQKIITALLAMPYSRHAGLEALKKAIDTKEINGEDIVRIKNMLYDHVEIMAGADPYELANFALTKL